MSTLSAPNKYADLEEASSFFGVSSATIKNWIKHDYFSAEEVSGKKLIFNLSTLEDFKQKIISGDVNRLNKRANKRNSSHTFVPNEYAHSSEAFNLAQGVVEIYRTNQMQIEKVLLILSVNLLKKHNLITYKKINNLGEIGFKNNIVKSEINWWLNKIEDKSMNQDCINLLRLEIPKTTDILGLVYQSLILEGKKAKGGSYYTPKKVVDDIVDAYIKENHMVLDPCCGTGQFLLSVANKVKNPSNIWGFDIDEIAVRLARLNIILHFPKIDFTPHIYHKNTLTETGLVGLFSGYDIPTFDAVITNPPWGVHLSKKEKNELKKIFPNIKSGETFSYFIQKGLDFLKEGGILSFVLPESILNIRTHKDIREILVNFNTIKKVKYLDRVFKNVFTPVIRLDVVKQKPDIFSEIEAEKSGNIHKVKQSRLRNNSDYVFNVFTDSKDITFFKKIYKLKHTTLKNNADWALGIVTGNNKKHLFNIKNRTNEPVLTGKEIKKFLANDAKNYIDFNCSKFQQVAPEYKYRANEKLIYKFISKELVFSYDNKQTLTLNSANILIPKIENYPIKTILALFNSTLYQFIFQKRFGSLKILKNDIEQLPLPIIVKSKHRDIEQMVNILLDKNVSEKNRKKIYQKLNDYIMRIFNFKDKEKDYIRKSITVSNKLLNNI